MSSLDECLKELDYWLQQNSPDLFRSLNPGISEAEIDAILQPLLPYKLPREVYTLYKWHNGQTRDRDNDDLAFLPETLNTFLPLDKVLVEYQLYLEYFLPENIGNSLWFPIFVGYESNSWFGVVCDDEQQDSSIIILWDCEDPDIYVWHSSLEAMIKTILDCFREGVYYYEASEYSPGTFYYSSKRKAEEKIRRKYSPKAYPFEKQEGTTFFSQISTRHWPLKWKHTVGLTEADYIPVGASMTIAEFLQGVKQRQLTTAVLQGRNIELLGTSRGDEMRLSDGTGEILILCSAGTIGFREIVIGDLYEVEVCNSRERAKSSFFKGAKFFANRVVWLGSPDDEN